MVSIGDKEQWHIASRAAEARRRVVVGGFWLDMMAPGWRDRIDWDGLIMEDCRHCVAGQALGDFSRMFRLGLSGGDAVRLGFLADGTISYGTLRQAWREVFA